MYQLLLLLHVAAVVAFIGTILTALIWQRAADRSRDRLILAHTYRLLNRFDAIATPITVITIAVTGVLMAISANLPILRTGWILWSLVAWVTSGLLFATKLLPLQKRLERETDDAATWRQSRRDYLQLSSRWARWAHLTLLGIVVAFCLMMLKPGLPVP